MLEFVERDPPQACAGAVARAALRPWAQSLNLQLRQERDEGMRAIFTIEARSSLISASR